MVRLVTGYKQGQIAEVKPFQNFPLPHIYSRIVRTFLPKNCANKLGATYTLNINTNTSPFVNGCPCVEISQHGICN